MGLREELLASAAFPPHGAPQTLTTAGGWGGVKVGDWIRVPEDIFHTGPRPWPTSRPSVYRVTAVTPTTLTVAPR